MAEQRGYCKQLDERPELDPELFDIWEGFWRLSNSRHHGATGFPQPISISELAAYCQIFNVGDVDDFVFFIQLLDGEYLKDAAKKHRAKK